MSSASKGLTTSIAVRRAMLRRGFTLLELLLALAILLTIGGIALPSMVRVLAEREFESAGDVVVNHLLLARSHAQSSGEMVEVRFIADPPHLEARRFDPRTALDESEQPLFAPDEERAMSSRSSGSARSAAAFTGRAYEQEESAPVLARGWAQRALPGDVRITRTEPERDDLLYPDAYSEEAFVPFPEEMDDAYAPPAAGVMEEDEPAFIRIAVFLPDGSALIADPVWLVDDDDRAARLTVNPWTGLAELERIEDLIAEEDAALEDEMEEDASEETDELIDEPDAFDDASSGSSSPASDAPASGPEMPDEADANGGSNDEESDRENDEEDGS